MRHIIWLDHPDAESAALVGSKAATLARLKRAGINVPDGFCITTRAYRDFSASFGFPGPDGGAAGPGGSIDSAAVPPALAGQVLDAYRRLCGRGAGRGTGVAVRSSASLEDLGDASFAGQYASVLNVAGDKALLEAVERCWASAISPDVHVYRTQRTAGQDRVEMGVIVQAMVPAAQAGVAFTIEPVSGRNDVIVVEATAGTGETLVGGEATPHRYALRRGDSCSEPADELLDAARLDAIVSLAEKVESWAGRPQDIEWAMDEAGRVFLLQARPITTPPERHTSEHVTRWTRDNVAEVIPGAVTPLSWSELDHLTNHSFRSMLRRLGAGNLDNACLFGRFYGHVYFNRSEFERLISRFYPSQTGWRAAPRLAWMALKALWALYRLPIESHAIGRVIGKRHRSQEELNQADVTELLALSRLDDWRSLNAAAMEIHLTVTVLAELLYQALDKLLARWGDAGTAACSATVTTGLTGLLSAEAGRALAALAQGVRRDERLRTLVLAASPDVLPDELSRTERGRELWTGIESFLADHGYGAAQEFELAAPRWRDDPALVLAALQAQVRALADRPAADPAAARVATIQAIDGQYGPAKRWFFHLLLHRAQVLTIARENLKYHLVVACGHVRYTYQALAIRLHNRGRLASEDDIFFLTAEEVVALVEGRLAPDEAQERLAERRCAWEADRQSLPPPALEQTDRCLRPALPSAAPVPDDGQVLHGVGVSPGTYVGRARVLRSPADGAAIEPGEILVAPATSPGWAPLFLSAGALVTEVGGLLSHGAIIAREYGLPAVLNVAGATLAIRTGRLVAVDGSRGIVRLLGE